MLEKCFRIVKQYINADLLFSKMCCYWSSCWGLLQSFLEIVLNVLCSWQIHGQGLHSPEETEESWVMMAQTFCFLSRDLSTLCGPCHSEDQKMKKAVCYCRGQPFPPPTLLRETLVHLQPSLAVLGNSGSQQMLCHHVFLSSWVQQQSRFGISSLQASLLAHIHHTETQITT